MYGSWMIRRYIGDITDIYTLGNLFFMPFKWENGDFAMQNANIQELMNNFEEN